MSRYVVLTAGRFGDAVAESLARKWSGVEVVPLRALRGNVDVVRGADFVAVALWRRHADECELLDAACAERGVPWSATVLEGALLIQGPVVVPAGPCFRCYWRRRTSHFSRPDRESALDAAYADPDVGASGFFPSAVALASAGLRMDARDLAGAAGRVRTIDLMTSTVDETRVVRVHACPRCSPARPGGERFVERLIPSFRELRRES